MYRAGIIGAGGVAGMGIFGTDPTADIGTTAVDRSHAGGYRAAEGVELVAIADVDEGALNQFGEAWDIPDTHRYASHSAMLAQADLDLVSVCTPSLYHREHVIDAARTDGVRAIWCEKPLACSVGAAEGASEVCAEEGVDLVVNHSQRFLRQSQTVRDAIADGVIGDVQTVTAASSMELFRVGTHTVDLVTFLLDSRAKTVGGYITGENESAEHLGDGVDLDDAGGGGFVVFEDDVVATYEGSAPRDTADGFIRISGTDGRLTRDERGWTRWTGGSRSGEPLEQLAGPTGGYEDDHRQSFENAAGHLVDLADGNAVNLSSGRDACRTVEILIGFFLGHETGSTVSMPIDGPLKRVEITSW